MLGMTTHWRTSMDSNGSGIDRRDFIKTTSAASLGLMAGSRSVAPLFASTPRKSPNEKVVVAVVGVNGRGVVHAQNFAKFEDSEVAYICDVDSRVTSKGLEGVHRAKPNAQPKVITDFRRALDDKQVDAIAIATPDHWHTPMTLLA